MDSPASGRARSSRLTPRGTYRLLWCDFVLAWVSVALVVILGSLLAPSSDPPLAIFLPLIPAGVAFLINGGLVLTNYQGVRDRLAQTPIERFHRRLGFTPVASRFGGVIITIMGCFMLLWGLASGIALLARLR